MCWGGDWVWGLSPEREKWLTRTEAQDKSKFQLGLGSGTSKLEGMWWSSAVGACFIMDPLQLRACPSKVQTPNSIIPPVLYSFIFFFQKQNGSVHMINDFFETFFLLFALTNPRVMT